MYEWMTVTMELYNAWSAPLFIIRFKIKDDLNIGILNWCVLLKQYLDFRRSKLNIAAVRYEDLVKHSSETRRKIFKWLKNSISKKY